MFLICWSYFILQTSTHARIGFSDEFRFGKLHPTKWTIGPTSLPIPHSVLTREIMSHLPLISPRECCELPSFQHQIMDGVDSVGGAIITKERFGFGTYNCEVRMEQCIAYT